MTVLSAQLPARAQAQASTRAYRARRQAEDLALIARIDRGDDDAFARLVEKYQRPLYWLAHDILLDAEEARDVVQETFVRVHTALHRYDRQRSFVNWVYRIARNLAIDAYRRRARRASNVEALGHVSDDDAGTHRDGAALPPSSPATTAQQHDVHSKVHAVLATLPAEYRVALTLREMHGMSPREIAAVTDTSYPTARWRLHRARTLFRKAWEERSR